MGLKRTISVKVSSARKRLLVSLTGPHLSLVISNLPPHLPMQPELPNSMLLWRIVASVGSLSVSFCNGPLNTPRPKSRHTSSEDMNLKSSLVAFHFVMKVVFAGQLRTSCSLVHEFFLRVHG